MVKQRMTALDVRASVEEMRAELIGLRLTNLYDIQARTFLFRFGDSERRRTVLLENGIRMHLTTLEREKPKVPSQFTLKLRKHVRAWRLASVTQLQHDRTVDLCFGVAGSQGCFHIIVELFAKGNVILTDHEYTIMMLLRTHKDEDVSLIVRGVYPVTPPFHVDEERQKGQQGNSSSSQPAAVSAAASPSDAERTRVLHEDWETVLARSGEFETLKSMLSSVKHFGPSLAEHIISRAITRLKAVIDSNAHGSGGDDAAAPTLETEADTARAIALLSAIKSNSKKAGLRVAPEALFAALLPALLEAWAVAEAPLPAGGYLIRVAKTAANKAGKAPLKDENNQSEPTTKATAEPTAATAASAHTQVIASADRYDDFSPVLLAQYEPATAQASNSTVTAVYDASFGAVCDRYFLFMETEYIEKHNAKQVKVVLSKREKFERDFQRRVSNLEQEQELNRTKGELIILHADKVDEAIDLINGAIAAGIQWDALKQLLRRRHAEGHPITYMINELLLEKNSMTVLLEQELYDDEDDNDIAPMEVLVDLGKTAHANAADYFTKKKANQVKLEKTLAAQDKAAAGADRKGKRLAAKQDVKKQILRVRGREWWEKMFWFVSSAGDVVLQGKDTQTTEIIVRRLLQAGDIMVHCDVDGALPCFVWPLADLWDAAANTAGEGNKGEEAKRAARPPISRLSVEEAGAWCVNRSSAYEQKNIIGSWWIYASQITGGSASGCYLFDGEKNHLPPRPLALGCGLLCRVTRDVRSGPPTAESNVSTGAATPESASVPVQEGDEGADGGARRGAPLSSPPQQPSLPLEFTRCPPWVRFIPAEKLLAAPDGDCIHADPAEELHELPSVEAIRPSKPPKQQQQQQQQRADTAGAGTANGKPQNASSSPQVAPPSSSSSSPAGVAAAVGGAAHDPAAVIAIAEDGKKGGNGGGGARKTTRRIDKPSKGVSRSQLKKEKLAARNERIAIEQAFAARQQQGDEDEGNDEDDGDGRSSDVHGLVKAGKGTFDPKKPPPPPQLTKHQKKKLKKIQAKYADQDDDDRLRGATLNGNQIAQVQARRLEAEAEAERLALEEAKATAKAERAKARKAGTLRYLHPSGDDDEEEEEEEEEEDDEEIDEEGVEVVDSFTDEDGEAVEATPEEDKEKDQREEEAEGENANNEVSEKNAPQEKRRHVTSKDAAHIAVAHREELRSAITFYTPYPHPTDTVQHVVCICAPLSVLALYPYRVELALVSGAKKGQVAEKIVEVFKARAGEGPEPGESASAAKKRAAAEAKRALESSTSTSATTITAATTAASMMSVQLYFKSAATNPAVLKALETMELNDVVEQLRGNTGLASCPGKGR